MSDDMEFSKDYKPVSSPETLKMFMEGTVYRDFLGELNIRIEQMRDFLELSDSKSYIKTQGGIHFARLCQDIFQNLLDNRLADLTNPSTSEDQDED